MGIRRRRNVQKEVGHVLRREETDLAHRDEGKDEILQHRLLRLCQKMTDEERSIMKTAGKGQKIKSKNYISY